MKKKQKKVLIRIIISLVLLVPAMIISHKFTIPIYVEIPVYALIYLIIGYDILRKAFLGIIHGQVFDENFLMAVATVGAFCVSEYSEAVAVMLFYQIGELFQSIAVGKSRKNIAGLMDIRPDYANIPGEDGSLTRVSPEEVRAGDVIVVCPGEKIPIDGTVEDGTSVVDTKALTGESVPRDIKAGDEVISGCINLTGVIRVRTTKEFSESTVSKILELVQNAGMRKARSEQFITRFAKVYTPVVCILSLLLFLVPTVISFIVPSVNASPSDFLLRALTFLVISCPCALVISIPLSFFGGIGGASSRGILIKGGTYLENLSRAGVVVFDKTGTLTKGVFEVKDIVPRSCEKDELLRLAGIAESFSSHPISVGIRKAYEEKFGRSEGRLASDAHEIAGKGVTAIYNGKQILAGNEKILTCDTSVIIKNENTRGKTVVHVQYGDTYMGCITVADVVKEEAASSLRELRKSGVRKIVMLTGDNRETAEEISEELMEIDEVKASLLPGDKVSAIEQILLENKGKVTIFVGDGVNDAPVLIRSDIGIAMGALGSDAAIEAADIVLMDDRLDKISLGIRISVKTIRIIYENIVFALVVKAVCLVLAGLGIANMWLAIFADVGVMILAVLNATRALRVRA